MTKASEAVIQASARTPEAQDPEDAEMLVPVTATGGAIDALTRSEIDMQIATAHKFPRSVKKSLQEAETLATLNEDIAGACYYSLERGGKAIEGPSIRLAEIIASAWGNLRYGARIVDEGERFITAEGRCLDLEKNAGMSVEVVRRITNKRGERYNDDMIQTTAAAAQSIALRTAILRVVPRAYVDDILEKAKKVAVGEAATLSTRRAKALEWFKKARVSEQRVLAKFGKTAVEDIGLAELEILIGLATALREGTTTVEAQFPPEPAATATPADKPQTKGDVAAEAAKVAAEKARAKDEKKDGAK